MITNVLTVLLLPTGLVVSVFVAVGQSVAGAPMASQLASWTGVVAIAGLAAEWGARKAKHDALKEDMSELGKQVNRIEDRIESRLARIESKIDNLGG